MRSLCVRNPDYWQNGKPYVDEWEDISIDDNSARLNALLGGQIDMMSQLDFAQAKAQKKTKKIQVIDAPSPAYQVFIMRVDRPPFNDVNVRQAMRLIVDRQALINVALGGFGTVGNDLFGYGLPYYAKSLKPREQDIEQAKSLLKKAGKSNLAVTLQTSDIVPGFTQAATLFAQQAQEAGVKVTIKKEPANAYFDTSLLYTKMDFAQSYWTTGSLAAFYTQSLAVRRGLERDPLQGPGVRQDGAPGHRRPHGQRGHRGLAQGAEDPVRARRLHRLGQPEHRRRRLEQGAGHQAERVLQPRRLQLPRRLARVSQNIRGMSVGGGMTGEAELPSAPPALARGDHPIARFVLRRIAAAVGTLLVISMLVFAGTEVLPGDAASAVLGKTATPDQVAELRKDMGLDRPIPVRYADWLGGFARGDLGDSAAGYAAGSPVPIWNQVQPRLARRSGSPASRRCS